MFQLLIEANRILAKSRDYEEQLHVWKGWREAVGPIIKPRYLRYIELINESARRNGKIIINAEFTSMIQHFFWSVL